MDILGCVSKTYIHIVYVYTYIKCACVQFSFIYRDVFKHMYTRTHMYTYERIFTCIYTRIHVCTYINRNGENLNQFFSLSQVDTPERSAILVYLRLSVSVCPLGAVPLCINNVIAICLQREAVSLV